MKNSKIASAALITLILAGLTGWQLLSEGVTPDLIFYWIVIALTWLDLR